MGLDFWYWPGLALETFSVVKRSWGGSVAAGICVLEMCIGPLPVLALFFSTVLVVL